jgi:thioredoxin reductase
MANEQRYDIAVIGGGPAGLTAALWLARYLHSVVLIDSGDPRNWMTRGINGFLGQPNVRPGELRGKAREECRKHGVELVDGMVGSVHCNANNDFALVLEDSRQFQASRVLLAIGLKDVWPDVPGLEHVFGGSAHVCPDCDGYEARDRKTVVIGQGRRAVGMALNLTTWTRQLVICTNGPDPLMTKDLIDKVDALNIPILDAKILALKSSNGAAQALELEGGMHLDCEKIFFSIGQYPADALGVQLGCERDEHGQIVIDDQHHTSVKNVFAAGDIAPGPQLAIRAAAGGAVAALSIHRSLVPLERRLS